MLTRYARYVSQVLGEQVLAELREDFVGNTLALPVGVVESAGSGDLLTRTSRDVDQLGWSVRMALPEWTIAVVTAVRHVHRRDLGRLVGRAPLPARRPAAGHRAALVPAPRQGRLPARERDVLPDQRHPHRDRRGRAHRRGARPRRRADPRRWTTTSRSSYRAERYTLFLRTVFFPNMEIAYLIPTVATLLFGGYLYTQGEVSLGAVTTATLYVQMLIDPVDRIVSILDELQLGAASLARLLGVAQVPDDREVTGREPVGEHLEAEDVRFSYVDGPRRAARRRPRRRRRRADRDGRSVRRREVHARPAARRHPPAAHRRGHRRRRRPGRAAARRPARPRRAGDPGAPRLRRHGAGEPGAGPARPDRRPTSASALDAVDALDWVDALPEGLDTVVGSGGRAVTAAQAQQIALARLVLADPHTLVLDEATSLIDPRAARHLERSLAAVLEGRTVIAIAHRLFSAHDADRVAVVEDGRIAELGSHDELVAAGGSYAALWDSWHGRG